MFILPLKLHYEDDDDAYDQSLEPARRSTAMLCEMVASLLPLFNGIGLSLDVT